ncbi:glycosyl hydrolase 2 galactose-binding domain-containing protein [Streptosporangium soli]|nr:glycoside hydrolase family 2 protein [Streptosporangium sp. KLBMP 9127]
MTTTTSLDGDWTLRAVAGAVPPGVAGRELPATVPGCVHTDLLTTGLIEDPYLDRNEETQHWIGRATWRYRRTFDLADDTAQVHELVFDGLDTIAEIRVNGRAVGETANMHRVHRFDVTDVVTAGENTVEIVFSPVREYAERVRTAVGERPNVYPEPFQYVRKMAANFGWDWGPNLVTAGIWKSARLESWSGARLESVRPHLTVSGADGRAHVEVAVVHAGEAADLTLELTLAGATHRVPVAHRAHLDVTVPDVDVWHPRGRGGQPLYELTVRLLGADGEQLGSWSRRAGFRTVEHIVEPDEEGTSFTLAVNGEPLFVRGVNWIPDDCFVSRVGRDRYRRRIEQAIGANVNLLRVWGGGIYEKDEFYEVCDELGVLVWQDFLFACAAYPEQPPIDAEVAAEARDNVTRLMPHPSLVLWNGNNENIWGFSDWGWREPLAGRDWGLGYYTELLPRIVAELDPTTPYWPGSPYSGSPDLHPNDPLHGNSHLWKVWNSQDYTTYAKDRPRFVSEFGYQGPPNWSTLTRAVTDTPLTAESPGVLHHQKAGEGMAKLSRGMAPHLPEPRTFDDWHYATQLNQARAIAFGVEHFRSLRPHCMGTILWQLNDCWPVISWAAIDGDGRLKPLWYELRRVYADRLVTIQPDGDAGFAVHLVNDGAEPWQDELVVERRSLDGAVLATFRTEFRVEPGTSVRTPVPASAGTAGDPRRELLLARCTAGRTLRFFREDRDTDFEAARFEAVTAQAGAGEVALTVTAGSLVRDIVVQADRVDPDALVDDQVVTLLPGEVHTFRIRTRTAAADPRWAEAVRCVNTPAGQAVTAAAG